MAPPRNVQLVVLDDRLKAFNSELTKEPRTFNCASVWKSLKPMAEENGVSLFAWIYRDGRGVWQITAAPQKPNEKSWPQQLVAGKGFFSSYSKDLPDPTEVQEWLLFESGQFQECPPGIVDCFSKDREDSNDYADGGIDGGEENGSISQVAGSFVQGVSNMLQQTGAQITALSLSTNPSPSAPPYPDDPPDDPPPSSQSKVAAPAPAPPAQPPAEPFPTAATSKAAPTVHTHPQEPPRAQTAASARSSKTLVKIGQIPLKKGGTLVLASGSPLAFVGDALVNATNEECNGDEGVDKLLNESGGPNLVKARKKMGVCDEGCANITRSFLHSNTKFIIHAVGPDYGKLESEPDPAAREEWKLSLNAHLFGAYKASMRLARDRACKTVGFCLLTASQSQSVRGGEALETLVENGVRALQAFGGYPGLNQVWLIGGSEEEAEVLERIAHMYSGADDQVAASSPPNSRIKYNELREQLPPGGGGGGAQKAAKEAEEYWTKQKADEEAGEKLSRELAQQLDQEEASDRAKASQAAAALQTAAGATQPVPSSSHHEEAPPPYDHRLANNSPSDHRAQQNNTHWSQPQLVAHFQRSQRLEVLGCVPLPPPLEDTATTVQKGGRKQQQQQAPPHGAPPPCLVLAGGSVVDFMGDAMVNAANEGCVSGGALDAAVNQAGGSKLMEERAKLGGCRTGCAKYTKSFNHKETKFIIHAVGPRFPFDSDVTNYAHGHPANYNAAAAGRRRGSGVGSTLSVKEGTILLAQAVTSVLEVAKELKVQTLGCCLLSAGVFRGSVPLHSIVQIAASTLYAGAYPGLREVWLVAYSPEERHVLRAIAQELMADVLPPSSALAQPQPPPAYATSIGTAITGHQANPPLPAALARGASSSSRRGGGGGVSEAYDEGRFKHYRHSGPGQPPQAAFTRTMGTRVQVVSRPGGATTLAAELFERNPRGAKIGLMIAANSGRPGGSVGGWGKYKPINQYGGRGVHQSHFPHGGGHYNNGQYNHSGQYAQDFYAQSYGGGRGGHGAGGGGGGWDDEAEDDWEWRTRGVTTSAVHAQHKTQEEDVVANWLVTETSSSSSPPSSSSQASLASSARQKVGKVFTNLLSGGGVGGGGEGENKKKSKAAWDSLFRRTIGRRWGLVDASGLPSAVGTDTIQGIDYVNTQDPDDFGDAWVVRGASVCVKAKVALPPQPNYYYDPYYYGGGGGGGGVYNSHTAAWQGGGGGGSAYRSASSVPPYHHQPAAAAGRLAQSSRYYFDTSRRAEGVVLVFSAGPNAGCGQSPTGSTARTLNRRAQSLEEYDFFRLCVMAAIRQGLDAMSQEGCNIALVARLSCGIYGGVHRDAIDVQFPSLVDEVLAEPVSQAEPWLTRGHYFDSVIIPMIE